MQTALVFHRAALALSCAWGLLGCDASTTDADFAPPDAVVDAQPDGPLDAAPQAQLDVGPDAASPDIGRPDARPPDAAEQDGAAELDAPVPDAPADASPDGADAWVTAPDASSDAAPDADLDANLDAHLDASPDAPPPDAAPPDAAPQDAAPPEAAPDHPFDATTDAADPDGPPDVSPDASPDSAPPDAQPDAAPDVSPDAAVEPTSGPVAILFIGDGMGFDALDAASLFAYGEVGRLTMQDAALLPNQGRMRTASLSGITDSAAAATSFATGLKVLNFRPGMDRDGNPIPNLFELGRERGFRTGAVTTTTLTHATPAGFTVHHNDRRNGAAIAAQQAAAPPDLMLGGGATNLRNHLPAFEAAGFIVVENAVDLAAVPRLLDGRLLGLFAEGSMTYVRDRPEDDVAPTLAQMTVAALRFLDAGDGGFLLMVEGARIDHAAHSNNLSRQIRETLAFDEAIAVGVEWTQARAEPDEVLLIVTSDHETGGLRVEGPPPVPGALPVARWGRSGHTNQRVPFFGRGPHSGFFAGEARQNTWIHSVLRAHFTGEPVAPPPVMPVADGGFDDLRYLAVAQLVDSDFGEGHNRLDALHVDVVGDGRTLAIGVAGLFETTQNAVVVLLDIDPGAGTGPARLAGALADEGGRADTLISALNLDAPPVEGFGADFAIVCRHAGDPRLGDLRDDAGLRGLRPPFGEADDFGWGVAAINFDEGARVRVGPQAPVPGFGFEVHVPLAELYPDGLQPGASVTMAALLVNSTGDFTSNQALPPFLSGRGNPGDALTAVPGLVHFTLDTDGDGVADGDDPPTLLPARD